MQVAVAETDMALEAQALAGLEALEAGQTELRLILMGAMRPQIPVAVAVVAHLPQAVHPTSPRQGEQVALA